LLSNGLDARQEEKNWILAGLLYKKDLEMPSINYEVAETILDIKMERNQNK